MVCLHAMDGPGGNNWVNMMQEHLLARCRIDSPHNLWRDEFEGKQTSERELSHALSAATVTHVYFGCKLTRWKRRQREEPPFACALCSKIPAQAPMRTC